MAHRFQVNEPILFLSVHGVPKNNTMVLSETLMSSFRQLIKAHCVHRHIGHAQIDKNNLIPDELNLPRQGASLSVPHTKNGPICQILFELLDICAWHAIKLSF